MTYDPAFFPPVAGASALPLGGVDATAFASIPLLLGNSILSALACPAYMVDPSTYRIRASNAAACAADLPSRGATCYAHLHGREQPCSQEVGVCPMAQAVQTQMPVYVRHVHQIPALAPCLENELVLPLCDDAGEISQVLHCRWQASATEARAWAAARSGSQAHEWAADPAPALTEREREVLPLVVEGLTNTAIARQLGVSAGAIKYHLGNLRRKLDASGRADLAALAVRHGLVRPD